MRCLDWRHYCPKYEGELIALCNLGSSFSNWVQKCQCLLCEWLASTSHPRCLYVMILLCLCGGTNFGQTRIEQISQLLTFGVLELEDNEDSFAESHHRKKSDHQLSREVGDFSWALALLLFFSFHST